LFSPIRVLTRLAGFWTYFLQEVTFSASRVNTRMKEIHTAFALEVLYWQKS
jgi:hypothetical protein